MFRRTIPLLVAPAALFAEAEHDHHDHDGHDHGSAAQLHGSAGHPHLHGADEKEPWLRFQPHLNAAVAIGGSTSEKNLTLVQGSHSPIDDGFNLQGIEIGGVVEVGEIASIHANHNFFWDNFDGWDGEWEEAYAAVKLPAGLVLRGGQFFAPFGYENTLHLHDRQFVEAPISMIRLLGEEGLVIQGAELAWKIPSQGDRWLLRFGIGNGRSHSHGATRELRREAYLEAQEHAQEHHEEEGEEHEEEEHHHHSHGFAGNGGIYDPEQAYLDKEILFGRLEWRSPLEAIESIGFSFASGENGFGRRTSIIGADLNGELELWGKPAWWRGESFYRMVDAVDHSGLRGDYDEFGIYGAAGCEITENWMAASRIEWASGNRMSGNERRWRASANVGRMFILGKKADFHTRLQYTYDRLGGYADEHSVWLQFVLDLGAAEHGHAH